MRDKLFVTFDNIGSKKGFDVLSLNHYPYGDVEKFDFLKWVGFEKCKIEAENRKLYDLVVYSENDFDLNFDESISDYYIYTDKFQRAYNTNSDDYPGKLIIPSFKFWFCNSITFNIISNFDQRLYDKTNTMRHYIVDSVSDEDVKFWHFLSTMIIRTECI